MPVRVVDASALGALLFGEPEAEEISARLSDATLLAPTLLAFELASVALKKIRSNPESEPAILHSLTLHRRMEIEEVDVEHEGVVRLARERDLTTYDASYLWLFEKLGADRLVTLDRELAAAARTAD